MDEEKRCSSCALLPSNSSTESLEQLADSGERFQPARGGPGEGMGRSGRTCAVVAVAGRGREDFFFFTVFPADRSGVAGAARQERRAVPDRSRGLGEGLCRFVGIGALVAVARTRRRGVFPHFVTRSRGFHFAGRELLFYGGTIAMVAMGVAGSIAVETLDDLRVLLIKAMQI